MYDALQGDIEANIQRWRHILRIILEAVIFCSKKQFRRLCSVIGNYNSGIFLNLLEITSHYVVKINSIS
jgi:hypothetical protein